jgi:site-specific recombinase XerD
MHDEGVVNRYLDHLRMRNLRPWTIYGRHRTILRLTKWVGGPVLYLTEEQMQGWQKQRSREIQPEPLRTETSHLRQFYRWAQREGFRTDDPTLRLVMPRVRRRVPRPIRDQSLADAMLNADPAMAAMLALASFAGLRACEIGALDWSEVGLGDRDAKIRVEEGKGGHGRLVPMSKALADVLSRLPTRKGPVIIRRDGRPGPVGAHTVSVRVNTFLHDMGIAETLHQCRHRFGTTTYQACQDLRAVQELLGHSSPATTAIYALAASKIGRAAVEAAGELQAS